MSDATIDTAAQTDIGGPTAWRSGEMAARIRRRYRRERLFRALGLTAILIAASFLATLLFTIGSNGINGFFQSEVELEIYFDPAAFGSLEGLTDQERTARLRGADYSRLVRESMMARFPDVEGRRNIRQMTGIISSGARQTLRDMVMADPSLIGSRRDVWLLTSDDIDVYIKGNIDAALPEGDRRVKDVEIGWIETLRDEDRVRTGFHARFLQVGDSREPELAGIWGAVMGSFLTLSVTLLVAFPVAVLAAIYLEEFAPQNRWTDLIEVNINNLAAVPSIVFGLLGLAVFLGTFNLPRSAPLVGGLTLALMTLPTIIIASRAAIKAVPPSIRDAARGLGASPMQVVFHHVVPLAMPGILTGTIIGMAQALGETAPLLMIGMVAFIVDVPGSITDAATVLPVQIYLWADSPERAFVEKTSAAILVLLGFLITMNALAIWLRNRFERRW